MEDVQDQPIAARKTSPRLTSKERGDRIFAYLINAPSVVLILALIAYPVGVSLWTSLHRYNLRRPGEFDFIGLGNYIAILTSYDFWHSLQVTLYFGGMSVVLVIAVSLGIAIVLNEKFVGRGIVRSLLLVPWAVPGLVNGLMWAGLLGEHGAFNKMLEDCVNLLNKLPGLQMDYLGMASPVIALNAAITAHVWRSVPFACIIFLAALQAIPAEQYRAARVDGANEWSRFRHITLPWLLHPIMIVAIFETMNGFRGGFDLIYALTGGGPGDSTYLIAWQTYKEGFGRLNFGRANAYSYLITLITMGLAIVYIRLFYRRGTVQG
ncbi:MAG: sugar ABC transporter permease [Candidatus Poribacteria bacterium]|nr:sugar ABC transporter permease [Candidatus Poribacteria bacterium]